MSVRNRATNHRTHPLQAIGEQANDVEVANNPDRRVAEAAETAPLFSAIERLVVGIGERDPLTAAVGDGLATLGRLLFGIEAPRPFADRRLEALRRLTIALRRSPNPVAALDAALAAGVTQRQIEHLRSRRPMTL